MKGRKLRNKFSGDRRREPDDVESAEEVLYLLQSYLNSCFQIREIRESAAFVSFVEVGVSQYALSSHLVNFSGFLFIFQVYTASAMR